MPHDQHQDQGSPSDKYGKEQKEQSKKGSRQDAYPANPEPQKGTEPQRKEEHRHQTGR